MIHWYLFSIFSLCHVLNYAQTTSSTTSQKASTQNAETFFRQGDSLWQQNKHIQAIEIFHKGLLLQPKSLYGVSSLGMLYAEIGQLEEALPYFEQAATMDTSSNRLQTVFNLGFHYLSMKRYNQALNIFNQIINENSKFFPAYIKAAQIARILNDNSLTLFYLNKAILLNSNEGSTYRYLGDTYNNLKHFEKAIESYEKAIKYNKKDGQSYVALGDTLSNIKRFVDAKKYYEEAIKIGPGNPDALRGLFRMKIEMCDWGEDWFKFLKQLNKSVEETFSYGQPSYLQPYQALFLDMHPNFLLKIARSIGEAIKSEIPDTIPTWINFRKELEQNIHKQQTSTAPSTVDSNNNNKDDINDNNDNNDNDVIDLDQPVKMKEKTEPEQKKKKPTFSYSELIKTPKQPKAEEVPVTTPESSSTQQPTATATISESTIVPLTPGKLRIGYLSRRFEKYAGTQLMLRVFGLHNREKFIIFSYSYGPDDNSIERQIVQQTSDYFRDIGILSVSEAAKIIAKDRLDLLIDLNGHHSFNNLGLLALLPAPVQATWLGFAGTTGLDSVIDYNIVDEYVVPEEMTQFYSEKLVYLADTYQPQDHLQVISETPHNRDEVGLPPDAFVFVCFNRHDKIEPDVFDAWLEILEHVPNSVLWLFKDSDESKINLIKYSETKGLDGNRIIFGGKLPKEEHLARHRLGDLFLDTFIYGAHTTTTDALWAGLPVLTKLGQTFASRVAGSLLRAAGLSELIVNTRQEYIQKAIELATNPSLLQSIKDKLLTNRPPVYPLFDTPKFVRGLETAYELMVKEHEGIVEKELFYYQNWDQTKPVKRRSRLPGVLKV